MSKDKKTPSDIDMLKKIRQDMISRIASLTLKSEPEQLAYLAKTLDIIGKDKAYSTMSSPVDTKLITPYLWTKFSTYDQSSWSMKNDAAMFGGHTPTKWTDGNVTADKIKLEHNVLRTLLNRRGYASQNSMVVSDVFLSLIHI